MAIRFDEISLKYWEDNKKKVGSSKSYTCNHNGYIYGDDMQCSGIEFVYVNAGSETAYKGKNDGPKWTYFEMVEAACKQSSITLNNFLTTSAEKFRIYTLEQVALFTPQKKNSTRIKDDSCKIDVNGTSYFVASNLKVCEYFNSASRNIEPAELGKWFIRIHFNDDIVKPMEDADETETLDIGMPSFTLTVNPVPASSPVIASHHISKITTVNVDFNMLNAEKKKIGDLGEAIVLDYEIKRLTVSGRADLAALVEHVAVTKGDGLGYDIQSFLDDGTPLYIEVKTTKQNKEADFYLSKKEKAVADSMYANGKEYRIYRVYKLNPHTGKGELIIYLPPFDDSQFDMEPENWKVKIK